MNDQHIRELVQEHARLKAQKKQIDERINEINGALILATGAATDGQKLNIPFGNAVLNFENNLSITQVKRDGSAYDLLPGFVSKSISSSKVKTAFWKGETAQFDGILNITKNLTYVDATVGG